MRYGPSVPRVMPEQEIPAPPEPVEPAMPLLPAEPEETAQIELEYLIEEPAGEDSPEPLATPYEADEGVDSP